MILSKVAALMTAAAMVLFSAGCASSSPDAAKDTERGNAAVSAGETGDNQGRYVETESILPPSTHARALKENADGSLEIVYTESWGEGPWKRADSTDGGATWQVRPAHLLEGSPDVTIRTAAYDQAGILYLLTETYTQEMRDQNAAKEAKRERLTGLDFPTPALLRTDETGAAEPIHIQWKRGAGDFIMSDSLLLADNGKMVVYGGREINCYDLTTGALAYEVALTEQISSVTATKERLYATCYGENEIERDIRQFDILTGEMLENIPSETQASTYVLCGNDKLRRVGGDGIFEYQSDQWTRIVDGEESSLAMPTVSHNNVIRLQSGDTLALCQEGDQYDSHSILLRYRFDENATTGPTEELVFFALGEHETVRQAIGLYQRRNPETRIRYVPALDPSGAATAADARRSLNVELLAGKGPDLMMLDGMNMDAYLEKGVLTDLTPVIGPALQKGELLPMAGAYEVGGAFSAVPLRFAAPVMWAGSECLAKASSLTELAGWVAGQEWKGEVSPLMATTPQELINLFYPTCSPDWIGTDGSIQPQKLTQFLNDIKTIADAAEVKPRDSQPPLSSQGLIYASGAIRVFAGLSQSFGDFAAPDAGTQQTGDGGFALLSGQAKNVYVPRLIMGINKNSAHQESAQSFVALALSEEVQKTQFGDGYAVNTMAFEKSALCPYPDGTGGYVFSSDDRDTGEMFELTVRWPEEATMQKISSALRGLDVRAESDSNLTEMIVEESADFFRGGKTAQEAAQAVVQRTQAYLAE